MRYGAARLPPAAAADFSRLRRVNFLERFVRFTGFSFSQILKL